MDGDENRKKSIAALNENDRNAELDKSPSSLDNGFSASDEMLETKLHPIDEIEEPRPATVSSRKPSTSNKSGSKPLSMSSMLKRNLTANDDVRRDSLRNESQSIDDIRFKREDAQIRPSHRY